MLSTVLRNAIAHAFTRHERSTRISTRGRQKKLSATYVGWVCYIDRVGWCVVVGEAWVRCGDACGGECGRMWA
jgi:hypothetical protein